MGVAQQQGQRFWRDEALPHIEARFVDPGQGTGYALHAHDTFSIGAITGGQGVCLNDGARRLTGPGTVVIVNPEAAHACRPLDAAHWSYRMLYVDAGWLAGLQRELGFSANADFRAFSVTLASRRDLFDGLVALCSQLADADGPALARQDAAVAFFAGLQQALDPAPRPLPAPSRRVERAADYIREHFARPVRLEEICAAADLSATHLIRSFKACYGMPPHAFLVNRRVEHSRMLLRRGLPIAEVAAAAGFADQAHLQRIFRRLVATTPGRYRAPCQRPA